MAHLLQNASSRHHDRPRFRAAAVALLLCASGVGGCASIGEDVVTAIYVDPSQYDLYSCLQLRTQRRALEKRVADVKKLIDKAQTGFAGGVISEVAYRNDYNSARGQYQLADRVWQRNRCDSERLPPEKITKPAAEPLPLDANEQSRPGEPFLRPQPDR